MIRMWSVVSWVARSQSTFPSAWAAGTLALANLVDAFAMLAQVFLTTQLLTKQQFGELGIAMAVTLVASAIFDFRVWEVMTVQIPRLQAKNDSHQAASLIRGCFQLELMGGMVVTVGLLCLSPVLASVFTKDSDSVLLFAILAIQPLIMSADEPARTLLRLNNRFRTLALWRSVSGTTQLVFVLVALMIKPATVSVAIAMVLAWLVRLVSLWILMMQSLANMGLEPIGAASFKDGYRSFRGNAGMLSSTFVNAIAARLTNRIDVVLLAWFSVPEMVAPYELARRLTSQVSIVIEPIVQVIFPKLSRLRASEQTQTQKQFLISTTTWLSVTGLPALAISIALIPHLFFLIFGEAYSSAGSMSQILMMMYLPLPLLWLRPFLASAGYLTTLAGLSVLALAVQLLLGLLFIPIWKGEAAAFSVVAGQYVWWISLAMVLWNSRKAKTEKPAENFEDRCDSHSCEAL